MIKALARLLIAVSLLAPSGTVLACVCSSQAYRDIGDLAPRNAHAALVRVSGVQMVRDSELQSDVVDGDEKAATRLYGEPFQSGGAIARYVLIGRVKGLKSNGLPRLEYLIGSNCSRGVAPGDFLLLFWDKPNTVLQPTLCEPRIVNLGTWLGFHRLLLADLRENVRSGRPMHPCDLSSGLARDHQQCISRRKQSMELRRPPAFSSVRV